LASTAGEGAVPAKPPRRHAGLGLLISALSLAACVWWALQQTAPKFPTSPTALAILGGTVAIYGVSVAARGYRWSRILGFAAIRTRSREPYYLTAVGYMGNTVLPARGGEVLRVLLLTERSSARWQESLGSIIPERLLDFTALAILLVIVTFAGVGGTPTGATPARIAAVAVLVGAVLGFLVLRLRARGRLGWIPERVRPFIRASRLLFTPKGLALLLLTLAIWTLDAFVFWLVAESLSIPIEPMGALMVLVIAAVFSIIPAGPAYAGTYDAAVLFALRALGIAGGAALAFLLLVRFVIFVPVTVVGLALVVTRYGGLERLRGDRARGGAVS
jgi:glycosyltransferase 2 family protein